MGPTHEPLHSVGRSLLGVRQGFSTSCLVTHCWDIGCRGLSQAVGCDSSHRMVGGMATDLLFLS